MIQKMNRAYILSLGHRKKKDPITTKDRVLGIIGIALLIIFMSLSK